MSDSPRPPDSLPVPPASEGASPGSRPRLPTRHHLLKTLLSQRESLANYDLRLTSLRGMTLKDLDLSGLDLTGACFEDAALVRVKLGAARLVGARFRRARLSECDFTGANLSGADFQDATGKAVSFSLSQMVGATLRRVSFRGADFRAANLSGCDAREADLGGCVLTNATLDGARLEETRLKGANLEGAVLDGVDLTSARGIPSSALAAMKGRGLKVRLSPWSRVWMSLPPRARLATAVGLALLLPIGIALRLAQPPPAPPVPGAPNRPGRVAPPPPGPDPMVRTGQTRRNLSAPAFSFEDGSFEKGTLVGWAAEGPALADQPICQDGATGLPEPAPGIDGRCWVSSEQTRSTPEKRAMSKGDDHVGTLTSGPFPIPSGTLSFRIAGGKGPNTRVELLVDGVPVMEASGQDDPKLRDVVWDLSPYRGKEGRVCIVDQFSGSWGRIVVDAFRLEGGGS